MGSDERPGVAAAGISSRVPDGTSRTVTAGSVPCEPRWYVSFCVVVDVIVAVGITASRAFGH